MKWFIGFFVLLVALVMISGCTQPAQTAAPTTTVPTTVPTTEQVTVATPVPTTIATTVATTVNVTHNTTAVVTPVKTVTAASMVTLIHIKSTGFDPQLDVVLPGTRISWVNDDTVPHAVKSTGKNDGLFTSDSIISNAQFGVDFYTEGTVEYALVDLPKINGTIVVKSGGTLTSYSK